MTRFRVIYSAAAIRALTTRLPEKVATAVIEFIEGPLAENPRRVGKQLLPPLERLYGAGRGEYRILYKILDASVEIDIVDVAHRRDIYRRR